MALLEEVPDDLGEPHTPSFVSRPRLWDATERFAQLAEYDAVAPSAQQRLHLFHPRGELLRALGMEALAGLPDLLDDVEPVDADLGEREVLLLQPPDVVRAIGKEEAGLDAVATLEGLPLQPHEERLVALEGGDDALVDGALVARGSTAQRAQHTDECHLGVLALLALAPVLLFAAVPLRAPVVSPSGSATSFLMACATTQKLTVADGGRAAATAGIPVSAYIPAARIAANAGGSVPRPQRLSNQRPAKHIG